MKRVKTIEWVQFVDEAIVSVAISRDLIHREYARLHQGSLASFAHLSRPFATSLKSRSSKIFSFPRE